MEREREREREREETQKRIRHMKEGKHEVQCIKMHDHITCKIKNASWVKTQSKLQHSQDIISHTILEYMKHYEHRINA